MNGNGAQDSGEPDLANVDVIVTDVNGNPQVVGTDANGDWTATVPPGATTANVDENDPQYPTGYTQTEGDDPTGVTAVSGNNVDAGNDGYFLPGAIAGAVLADTDGNGSGDVEISGVTLTLLDAAGDPVDGDPNTPGTQFVTSVTDSKGNYNFNDIPPGTYGVLETQPGGYLSVSDKDGGDPDRIHPIVVPPGGTNTGNNFIEVQPATIGDFVWNDANANGQQDGGETGLDGVTVTLYRPGFGPDGIPGNADDSDAVATTTTSGGGAYGFTGLRPGTYQVNFGTLAGYNRTLADYGADVTDSDANAGTGQTANIVLAAGGTNNTIDAGYYQPGTVFGHLYIDVNGNGAQDSGEPDLANVDVIVTDVNGNPQVVGTDANGDWTATVPPGATTANVDENDPQYPAGYTQTEGDDPTGVTAVSGNNVDAGNDGYFLPGSITGSVFADTDNDNDGNISLGGVSLILLDSVGATVDTTTTASDGSYSFSNLPPGTYRVVETQPSGYLSVTDKDGGNPDEIEGIVVAAGAANTGNDFIEEQAGNIGDYVWMDLDKDGVQNDGAASGVNGVTVGLLDGSGVVVATTVTADDGSGNPGFYHFGNLVPGTYSVRFTLPDGAVFTWQNGSLSATDNSDADRATGETPQIDLSAGDNITYLDAGLKCPDTWADWKQLHPGENATENLDADAYGNFAEYAFAMPDDGTGSPHLDATAWIIRPSALAPGTLEAVFVRPTGWDTGLAQGSVTYTLQYAASVGNPTVWQSIAIDLSNATVTDNGDCTETVVIHDLETLTGLTGGTGVVRVEATQSDPAGPDSGAVTHSEPEGWTETPLDRCCQTYGTPYQRETVFTGTVDAVSGQDLAFPGNDLTGLPAPGVSYYAEVLSGDNAGQRFDVAATGNGTVTLAADADVLSATPPFNTLTTIPASLVGDVIAIRPHWTLGGLFPAAGLVASGANTSADQVQTYAAGAWTTYWLYDLGDADPATARWVKTGDPTMADAGGAVIPPGQGMFFTKRVSAAALLTYGEIRTNPFVRPLATGAPSNLVSGGYPLDQSPVSRELTTAEGFLGTKDFKTADSIFVWQNDASPPFNSGYDTYWLLNSTTPQALNRWVKQGDPTIAPKDNTILFEYDRAVFLRTAADQTSYKVAAPWTP